jgi:hypothetical protein
MAEISARAASPTDYGGTLFLPSPTTLARLRK